MIKKISNTVENIGIALIVIVVTSIAINFISIKPLRKEIRHQTEMLANIASQPRYSISNDFEKMRTREGGEINLNLSNELHDNHIESSDTVTVEKAKKGFLKKIFKKKR
jgi:hypothetical protein